MDKRVNMVNVRFAVTGLFEDLVLYDTAARSGVAFMSEKFVVRLTRQFKHSKRNTRETLLLTYGAPNYAEREFIKKYKKKHGFAPTGTAHIKFWPKPRAKKGKK